MAPVVPELPPGCLVTLYSGFVQVPTQVNSSYFCCANSNFCWLLFWSESFPSIDINDRNSTDVGGVTVTGIMALAKGEDQDGQVRHKAARKSSHMCHPPTHNRYSKKLHRSEM